MRSLRIVITLTVFALIDRSLAADESPTTELFFHQRVEPILVGHCLECHGEARKGEGLKLRDHVAGDQMLGHELAGAGHFKAMVRIGDQVDVVENPTEDRFRQIAHMLVNEGSAPGWFAALEYIEWDGKIKDLRQIPNADPARTVIVDDYEAYIHPRQRQLWLAIRPFHAPYPEDDRELLRIRRILERMSTRQTDSARGGGPEFSGNYQQASAIPFRVGDSGPEVLLVTSISSGKWILPKGNVDPGCTPAQAAEI